MSNRKIIYTGIGLVIIIGLWGFWYSQLPRYMIIQQDREILFGSNDTSSFKISPAKIKVLNLKQGKTMSIPVSIINRNSSMTFEISSEQPAQYDNGYINAEQSDDYQYAFNTSKIVVPANSTARIRFNVTRISKKPTPMIEKGFKIAQVPSNEASITIARAYIFEVLLP